MRDASWRSSLRAILSLIWAVGLAFGGTSCSDRREATITAVEFGPRGAVVKLSDPVSEMRATVRDDSGTVVGSTTVGSGEASEVRLAFQWEAGRRYVFDVEYGEDKSTTREAVAPAKSTSPLRLELQIPYGRRTDGERRSGGPSLMVLGSESTAVLVLENLQPTALDVDVELLLPRSLSVSMLPPLWRMEESEQGQRLRTTVTLAVQGETWYSMFSVRATAGAVLNLQTIPVNATWRRIVDGRERRGEEMREAQVKLVSKAELAGLLEMETVRVPTSMTGEVDVRWSEGTILLPETRPDLLRSLLTLNREIANGDKPAAYAKATVRNEGDADVIAMLKMQVVDIRTGEPVAAFAAVDPHGGAAPAAINVVAVPSRNREMVTLPIYANEDALAGEYLLRTQAYVFGTDVVIDTLDRRLIALRKNSTSALVTMAVVGVAVIALLWLALKGGRALSGYRVRTLVTVALFGASIFVSVNIPSVVFDDAIRALLGPFSFVINGFFNELLLYLLIVCLVTLIPSPGVVTLVVAVRFLLGGVILGNFTPVSLLSATSVAVVLETMLFLAGFTRSRESTGSEALSWNRRRLFRLAGVCGVAQVINLFVGFNLMMFLYRLYYADWYLAAYFVVCGLGYTAGGAVLGVKLGLQLRRVID